MLRPVIDCIVLVMLCVAAGFNLWDIMLRDAPKKRILTDAVLGLVILVLWVGTEMSYLLP